MQLELDHNLFPWVNTSDLEPSVSAVKIAPGGISHLPFHCVKTCRVTTTEMAPNCVEIRYKNSRQHHAMFHQLRLYLGH